MNRESATRVEAAAADPKSGLDVTPLTPTERQVVTLALTGRSVRAIAEELVVSESTVHTHLTHIYRKLGIRSRLDLLALAARADGAPASKLATTTRADLAADLLATVLATALATGLVLLGLVLPLSTVVSGPGLLAGGAAARRVNSPIARRASLPLLLGGLLCTLLMSVGVLFVVRTA